MKLYMYSNFRKYFLSILPKISQYKELLFYKVSMYIRVVLIRIIEKC